MRTVQEIFDEAVHLIDAQNESTGSTHTADTREYEVKAGKLVSSMLNEAYPFSDTYNAADFDPDAEYAAGDCAYSGGGRWLCVADGGGVSPALDAAHWVRTGGGRGKRPTHPPVSELTDPVYMDDFICLSVLPAGLAALLVFDEDKDKYNAFWGDYQSRLAQAKATLPAGDGFEDIENPYAGWDPYGGGIEFGQFGSWG